jgi:hypothetical protein
MGYSTGYKTKHDKRDNFLFVVVVCGVLPLIGWRLYTDAVWPDLILKVYLLTAPLFGMLLPADYPPRRSTYFWKAMAPIVLVHSVVLLVVVKLTLYFAYAHVKLPVRIVFGFITAAVFVEYFVSLRVIRAVSPKRG